MFATPVPLTPYTAEKDVVALAESIMPREDGKEQDAVSAAKKVILAKMDALFPRKFRR